MTGDDDNGIGDRTEVVPYDQATRRPGQAGPKRLGRYTLERIIAQGGMAEIWLAAADGPAGFQKKVVVKRIRPGLIKQAMRQQQQDPAARNHAVEMFVREARLLARLEHRNIVQVFELGVQPSKREGEPGEHFIVMEYLEGVTLKDLALRSWEAKQPLPIETIVRVVADVCLGLDHAHRLKDERGQPANLVHRDISPDNLFVTTSGTTKLLDFGIAKREDWSNLTQAGELKGKVPYMAPEQLKGQRLDARTDLFAIGVVLYWLLAGRRPFDGPSDIFTMKAILDDPPPSLRQYNPHVPPMLEDIVLSCLQKEPGDRISSAAALHDALSMVLMSTPGVQVEVSTLVAAVQPLDTPGFEVVPDVAAVPSSRWGTLRPPTSAPRGATQLVPADISADADTQLQVDPADIPSTIPPPTQVRAIPVTSEDPTRQRQKPSLLPLPPVPPPAPRPASPPVPTSPLADLPPPPTATADGATRPASRPSWKDAASAPRDTVDLSLAELDTRPQQRAPAAPASITLPQPMPSPARVSSRRLQVLAVASGASLALMVLAGLAWIFGLLPGSDAAVVDAGPATHVVVADAGASPPRPVDAGAIVTPVVVDAGDPDAGVAVDAGAAEVMADAGSELPDGDYDDAVEEAGDGGVATPSRVRRRRPPRVRSPAAVGEGFLVVRARPWAKVAIDGLGLGTTPLPAVPLPAGKHRVKLEHDGVVKFQTIEVEPQKTTTIQVDMRE